MSDRCQKIIPSTGKPCKYRAKDNGFCKWHGGTTDKIYLDTVKRKQIVQWHKNNIEKRREHTRKYQEKNKEYYRMKWHVSAIGEDYATVNYINSQIRKLLKKENIDEQKIKSLKTECRIFERRLVEYTKRG